MLLPALDRLRLPRTGEFYPLSQPELTKFEEEDTQDPITLESFERDSGNGDADGWRTFRVRNKTPQSDDTYKYHYYKASALWRHYNSSTPKRDPLTNQPIWYEDWMALHDVYDAFSNATDFIPSWVYNLPTREPGTVKAQPSPTSPPTSPPRNDLNPVPVRRQNGIPRPLPPDPPPPPPRIVRRMYRAYDRAQAQFDQKVRYRQQGAFEANQWPLFNDNSWVANAAASSIQRYLDTLANYHGTDSPAAAAANEYRTIRNAGIERRARIVREARQHWRDTTRLLLDQFDGLNDEFRQKQLAWDRLVDLGPRPTEQELRDADNALLTLEDGPIKQALRSLNAAARERVADLPEQSEAQHAAEIVRQSTIANLGNILRHQKLRQDAIDAVVASSRTVDRALFMSRSGLFNNEELGVGI